MDADVIIPAQPQKADSPKTAGIAPTAQQDVPAAFAPLVRNAWYVIAETKDVGRELRGIQVLGERLVYYRTENGDPVVLDDRCAHRRFPLSKSKLVGDVIQCGYHGFKYDRTGACMSAPGLAVRPGFGVRKYPAAERGPWLWVWMGDGQGDPALIPLRDYESEQTWYCAEGYKLNPGNYMLLIENLLDLTHLYFLHGMTSLEQASNPALAMPGPPNSAGWVKETASAPFGGIANLYGADPARLIKWIDNDMQFGPSLNVGETEFQNADGDDLPLPVTKFYVVHAITPADESSTHQFFRVMFSDKPVESLEGFIAFLTHHVFQEDVDTIAHLQSTILSDHRLGAVEFGIPTDRYAASMRQILRAMRKLED